MRLFKKMFPINHITNQSSKLTENNYESNRYELISTFYFQSIAMLTLSKLMNGNRLRVSVFERDVHSRSKLHLNGEGKERASEEDESRRKIVRTFAKLVEGLFCPAANFLRYPIRARGGKDAFRNGNFSFQTARPFLKVALLHLHTLRGI